MTWPQAPWITYELKAEMRERDELQKKSKLDSSNQNLKSQYKNEKKRIRSLIHTKKSDHFKYKFSNCKGNVSNKWKIVHEMIPNKKQ